MGLFDKIKDNAKTISMKAIEATREYDEEYLATETTSGTTVVAPDPVTDTATSEAAKTDVADTAKTEEKAEKKETKEPAKTEKTEEKTGDTKPAVKKTEKDPAEKEEKSDKKESTEPKPVLARRSRIIEVSKDQKDVKPYQPFYKSTIAKPESKSDKPTKSEPTSKSAARPIVVDVAAQKIQDPVKRAMYARERAAMVALANQRRLNGTVPLYSTTHMNFKTKVYINRIEYSGSFGKNTLPVEQIAWVKLRSSGTGVIIETTEGKRVVMVVKPKDRLDFAEAVLKIQELQPKRGKFKDTQTLRIDQLEKLSEGVDEIEKLARLYDRGILTQEEFEAKKKQILGI